MTELRDQIATLRVLHNESDLQVDLLFQHNVLYGEIDFKRYLKEVIEKHKRMKIQRTRLIYTYDPINSTNFHKYIDEKPEIVVIIKLVNGGCVAAYSEGQFKRETSTKDGLIISLTNREYFTLVEKNRRAITYDDFYLIFGNSEIRLRSQDKELFSNFGISNGYFASRNKRVNVLLCGGENERQINVTSYEVYQLSYYDE